jgi:hypothetical protein
MEQIVKALPWGMMFHSFSRRNNAMKLLLLRTRKVLQTVPGGPSDPSFPLLDDLDAFADASSLEDVVTVEDARSLCLMFGHAPSSLIPLAITSHCRSDFERVMYSSFEAIWCCTEGGRAGECENSRVSRCGRCCETKAHGRC